MKTIYLIILSTFFASFLFAQKKYTQGCVLVEGSVDGKSVTAKIYFRDDTAAKLIPQGIATVKTLTRKDYLAVLVSVPATNTYLAGVATPGEVEEYQSLLPVFSFEKKAETRTINGYNCYRVIAKDSKSGVATDIWVTNDISAPPSAYDEIFANIGGVPIEFTTISNGKKIVNTIKTINDDKIPDNMFVVTKDFQRLNLTELNYLLTRSKQ